jgi:hypothetical protein
MTVNVAQMKKDVAQGVMIGRVTWAALIEHALGMEQLVHKVQEILGAHLPPDGATEAVTLNALYELLDGPEYRAVRDGKPQPGAQPAPVAG